MTSPSHFSSSQFTLREVLRNLREWTLFFSSKWKMLLIAILIGSGAGALYSVFKRPVYHADTTFVLEEGTLPNLGQMSGIASLLGVNLGGLGGNSGLFQGDNIMELYRSDRMLVETLLSPFDEEQLLVDRYVKSEELEEKWAPEVNFSSLKFSSSGERSVTQDSVLKEVAKLIREEQLSVAKIDRKLGIIRVSISSQDEAFAKEFNEALVNKVNTFYFDTKTKKTGENLRILQLQADSVRTILDQSMGSMASAQDRIPNANPLLSIATLEGRKKQIDVQSSAAVYQEIIKNLEVAKINHRINSPLIQIIDSPSLPLTRSEVRLGKGAVSGGIALLLLGLVWMYMKRLYEKHLQEG